MLPVDGAPIAGGAVRVEGAEIAEVSADLEPDQRFDGCAILPGLVNAHSHLEYAGMSGFGDGRPFDGWIADHIRRRDGLGRDDYLAQARAGVAESLACGVTTIADCCYAGTVADAAAEMGMRAIVYLEAFSRHDVFDVPLERRLDELQPRPLVTAGHLASRPVHRRPRRLPSAGSGWPASWGCRSRPTCSRATWTSIRPRTSATSWARTRP